MNRLTSPLLLCAAAVIGVSGCDQVDKVIESGDAAGAAVPTEVQRVFDDRCGTGGCHDATAAGGLVLTAPNSNSIIGGSSTGSPLPMVALGDISGSYLALKILEAVPAGATIQGARMPIGGNFDDPELAVDLALVLGWVGGASLPGGSVDDDGDDGDDGGNGLQACSIFELAPGASSPVVSGPGADTIPTEIGVVLEGNCGCHYASSAELGANGGFAYNGALGMSTYAEFQEDYSGSNSNYAGLPNWEAVRDRVGDGTMPMAFCVVEGGAPISTGDRDLLLDWLGMGAPDAPTYAGEGGGTGGDGGGTN